MASDTHKDLLKLVKTLADQGKYLSIEVHDDLPASFAKGDVHGPEADVAGICCRRWGYDPNTGQKICVEPC